jgi:hypothetical protein
MSINKITTEETTTNLVKFGQNGATISANPSKNFAWVARSAANTVNYRAICYGNGLFVAAGWNNTNNIMTSTDGYNWIERGQGLGYYNASCVCYGELSANNMYVIMANNYYEALTSTNGINWVSTTSIGSNFWGGVCFGYDTSRNGLFVAVTYSGSTNSVATSSNGINWTLRYAVANTWRSVCYGYDTSGTGLFVAVSTSGTNRVMYSYNGITWTGVASANESAEWYSVCYGNGLFVAVANAGTGNRVMTSSNGITWTSRTAVSYSWRSVCYGNGLFTAVADVGFGQNAMTSSDGINWTLRTTPFDISYAAVTYGNGTFIAVAEYASITNKVMTNDYTANDNMLVLNGGVGIGTSNPQYTLDVNGSARIMDNIQMGTGSASYRRFTMGGGNSFGYLYGAFNQLGDGIHMGYNAYNDNASWKLNATGFGSGTSRISMGYGYIGLYTAPEGSSPPTNLGLYQNASGQVGIGTTTPTASLTVNGQTKSLRNTSSSTLTGSLATAAFNIDTVYSLPATSYVSSLSWSSQTTNGYNQNAFLGSKRENISTFGSVIIGVGSSDMTINHEFLFSSNGNAYCPGTWQTSSDVRLKTDITDADLNICYDNMKKLKLRRWKWRNDEIPELMKIDKHQLGWIAQELEEISPNSVSTMGMYGIEDCKHIETIQIQSFMYGTIQKLMNITEQQQIIIEQLQQRIQVLESK